MTTADQYVNQVVDYLPRAVSLRSQIAQELRALIAERVERGESVDHAIQQLGDPATLAEAYLEAVPLIDAPFPQRVAAKLVDVALFAAIGIAAVAVSRRAFGPLFAFAVPLVILAFWLYTVLTEYLYGQTLGKRLLGLRVVRASGARLTLGDAFIRQLPMLLQIFLIDIVFALFTAHRQRAFEVLTKTRVVLANTEPAGHLAEAGR